MHLPHLPICRPKAKAFLLRNFLVIGLVTAIVFSLACPWPGRAVNSVKVGSFKVFSTINIITQVRVLTAAGQQAIQPLVHICTETRRVFVSKKDKK